MLNTKSEPRSCKNLYKWNCLAHTRTQHIRFQSINIAYTQRAAWHKKDAAAGDKQTNKQRTKPNQSDVGTIHKFEQGTKLGAGGAGGEGRGRGDSTPGQVERFKKKMDQYFAAARAKTLTCQCVLARTIVCGIVTFLPLPHTRLFPFPLPHLCQHLGVLFFVSLSSQRVKSELDFSATCWPQRTTSAATLKWQLASSPATAQHPPPFHYPCLPPWEN